MRPNRLWLLQVLFAFPQIIMANELDQLNFDDFTDFHEATTFFQGVQPVSYVVHLRLPLEREGGERNDSGSRYVVEGGVSLTFRWVPSATGIFQMQRLLALHTKFIKIRENSIRLFQLHHLTGVEIRRLKIQSVTTNDDEEVTTIRLAVDDQLKVAETYRLEIGEFIGRVEDEGSKNGIFLTSPGLATQFQLNDARTAFPCVDMPGKKAVFNFSITHPSSYIALLNTDMDIAATGPAPDKEGWTKTAFNPTPIMSTYILAFALIPKTLVERASSSTNTEHGIRVSLFYNPDRLTDSRRSAALLKYASQVFDKLQRTFTPRYPLPKLDVSVVKGLSILGMENWGLVNLREEFVIKENEIEQFGLLTHEFVHQWIGNLATTADWRHLCVQEGLTEHYARRTLADFYGGTRSWQYQRYIFIRYLPAVQNETNNVQLKPIRQEFQGFDEAVAYCFGRVPFIWTMIERLVGGRKIFDDMINRFLVDYSFKSFVLDDLSSYLNKNGAWDVLRFYVDHGGYPSLFVTRINATTFQLRQRQIIPLVNTAAGSAIYEIPSLKDVWPIPLSTTDGPTVMWTSDQYLPIESIPFDDRGVPLLNPDFAYFYRVNYDEDIWKSIADAVLTTPKNYTETTRAQFINDFCFFRGLNLISEQKNGANLVSLTKRFLEIRGQLEIDTDIFVRFYIRGC